MTSKKMHSAIAKKLEWKNRRQRSPRNHGRYDDGSDVDPSDNTTKECVITKDAVEKEPEIIHGEPACSTAEYGKKIRKTGNRLKTQEETSQEVLKVLPAIALRGTTILPDVIVHLISADLNRFAVAEEAMLGDQKFS